MVIQFTHNSLNPADSTSYWFTPLGTGGAAGTSTAARFRTKTNKAVSIFGLLVTYNVSTPATSEGVTLKVRNHTQGTEANFTTSLDLSVGAAALAYTAILSANSGDEIEVIMTTPVWVTNPLTMVGCYNLYW